MRRVTISRLTTSLLGHVWAPLTVIGSVAGVLGESSKWFSPQHWSTKPCKTLRLLSVRNPSTLGPTCVRCAVVGGLWVPETEVLVGRSTSGPCASLSPHVPGRAKWRRQGREEQCRKITLRVL